MTNLELAQIDAMLTKSALEAWTWCIRQKEQENENFKRSSLENSESAIKTKNNILS